MIVLGVDIGGTFTDFVLFDGKELRINKVASTPHNPAEAVLRGIEHLELPKKQIDIVHGSTVATNTLLERKGARVAVITTKGYEDILEIGRQVRSKLYDLFIHREPPIAPARLRWGVDERVTAAGRVLNKVKKNELRRIKAKIREHNIEAVAVCFLFSYKNQANEEFVVNGLKQKGLHISASHIILPEYREYERFSTTVVNAYVTPVMSRYITSLEADLGVNNIRIMQSNGGSISTGSAKERSVNCILSGPAGGVIGASEIAKAAGIKKIVTFDMGGTSTDVSLYDGDIRLTTDTVISGIPIKVPVIDIFTVGAGGGSIAFADPGGALRVGPQSAGADPGPICYGMGNELTVTDANLVLGRIHPERFLGGRMSLYTDRASAYMNLLAKKLKMGPLQVAEVIVNVANSNMERAVKVISIEKGHDVRDFTLFSFGGAGGLHACELAGRLSMKGVIVPVNAGVLSALGMAIADIVKDYSGSILLKVNENDYKKLLCLYKPLIEQCMKELLNEGIRNNNIKIEKYLDIRYAGQSHELTLPFKRSFIEEFHTLHKKSFGYANRDYDVEAVNIRVRGIGRMKKPAFAKRRQHSPDREHGRIKKTRCFYSGKWIKADVYDRSLIMAGYMIRGPALVIEDTSTTFLPPEFVCNVDEYGNLFIKNEGGL